VAVSSVLHGFNATATKTSTRVTVSVSASNATGPRVLILYIADGALGSQFPNALSVLLDGVRVQEATSVIQLLDVTQQTPLYATTATADGYEVIVYVPHLTDHTVVLEVPQPNPVLVPSNYIPFVFLLAAIAAAVANILLARRRKSAPGKRAPEKKEQPKAEKKPEPWTSSKKADTGKSWFTD
jgi:hypothetical protein